MKSQRKTGKEKETNWESMQYLKNNQNDNGQLLPISKTLNIKRLNSPIKRHRVAQWKKKKISTICCLPNIHISFQTDIDWRLADGKIHPIKIETKSSYTCLRQNRKSIEIRGN